MVYIIVKKYQHFNRSFKNWNSPKGRYISSKADYEKAMKEEGMIPFEENERIVAEKNKAFDDRTHVLSDKAENLIRSVHKDKNGKIKMSDRQIEALKQVGAKVELPNWLPKHYQDTKGGLDASS